MKNPVTAFLSPYLPRQCGIATFTGDLFNSIVNSNKKNSHRKKQKIVALEDEELPRNYGEEVSVVIKDDRLEDYFIGAEIINSSDIDTISLQHEYNLYGGNEGEYILDFLKEVKKPVVTTMHTVYQNPSRLRREVTGEIGDQSAAIVVMAKKAGDFLKTVYGIPKEKIKVIPHGIHRVTFADSTPYKSLIGEKNRKVILTFGLLDRLKGVEYVIDAMEEVKNAYPEAVFIVLGATHPVIKKKDGERYRESLQKRVEEKGLVNHVKFHDEFVPLDVLIRYLMATDIFITPYLNKERITSGALAYALSCGKAVISTPYYYAEEMLAKDNGRLVPFKDSEAIAHELKYLLKDNRAFNRLRKNAYKTGLKMRWSKVAEEYNNLFGYVAEKNKTTYGYGRRKLNVPSMATISE